MSKDNIRKAVLLFASSLTVMAGAVIAASLPSIEHEYDHLENAAILSRLILTAPALSIAIMAPFAGLIADKAGRKRLLLGGLILYGVSGTSGFYLTDIYQLLAGRAVLGVAVAAIMTAATSLIGDYYQGEERRSFLGYQAAFMALGGLVYISSGGFLAEIGWHFPFLIYLASFLFLPVASAFLYEPARESDEEYTQHTGAEHSSRWLPRLKASLVYLSAFLGMAAFYLIPTQLPYLLEKKLGVTQSVTGLVIGLSTLTGATMSFNFGKLKKRLNYMQIMTLLLLLLAGGYYLIAEASDVKWVFLAMFLTGPGVGMLMPNLNLWIIEIAPDAYRGRFIGALTASIFLGQFFSPYLADPLLRAGGETGVFHYSALIIASLAAVYFVTDRISVLLNRKRVKTA